MMAPNARLLWWTAGLVLPVGAVAGVLPAVLPMAVLLVGGLLVLVLLDAALGTGAMDGVSIETPDTVRLVAARPGQIDLRLCAEGPRTRWLRLGLALPAPVVSPHETLAVAVPGGARPCSVPWPCTAQRRGTHRLELCGVECDSPLGFWSVRRRVALQTRFRVYPNLLGERRHLAALFLNRGGAGVHAQRQVGQGHEFEKLREYVPGDSYDGIHWKATAKHGRPISKEFQVERTQEVYVVLDTSRLSARRQRSDAVGDAAAAGAARPVEETALDRFVTATLILGLAAERQGDRFGMIAFSDRVHTFVRARNGAPHYRACRDALHALEPEPVNPDLDELCALIRVRLRRRALLVFLTDLDDPVLAESFVHNMGLLGRQHLILAGMLKPPGADPLFSAPDVGSTDDVYARLGGHLRWRGLRELGRILQRHGVRFSVMDRETLCPHLVAQYMSVKQRQLL